MKISAVPSKFQTWMDRIWAGLFLTPGGKPKSTLLLYSFCLSFVLIGIYGLSYFYLIDWIEYTLADLASVGMRNFLQTTVPGLMGTLLCCLAWFIPVKDKRLLPYAFLWICAYALLVLITMLILLEREYYTTFIYFFASLVPVGLISGVLASQLLYRSWLHRENVSGVNDAND